MSEWVDVGTDTQYVEFETTRNRKIKVVYMDVEDGAFIEVSTIDGRGVSVFDGRVAAYLAPEDLDRLIVELITAKLKNEEQK